ncbi:MAG: amidohydrolase family protein, partial [Chloroflexota bacterium]
MPGYDMLITGGRVLDYQSGLDAVRDIGVRDGVIQEVSEDGLSRDGAAQVVNAEGKWVMPGVVDAHVHVAGAFFGPSDMDYSVGLGQLAVAGVTTALDLGGTPEGVMDSLKRGGAGINVGGLMVMAPGVTITRDDPPRGETRGIVSDAIQRGALGIKMLGGYHPFTEEVTAGIIEECNEQRAYIAFHVGTKSTGSRLDGLRLVPDLMGSHGRLHIAHVNAYCRGSVLPAPEETLEALEIISGLRGRAVSEVHMAVP